MFETRPCIISSPEVMSSMRHFHLLLFRRHTSARLPPVTHPPTPRTYVSPTCGFDVNEQKRILSGKQPGVPHPTPGYLYCVHQARVTIGTGDHDGRRTKKNGEKTRKEKASIRKERYKDTSKRRRIVSRTGVPKICQKWRKTTEQRGYSLSSMAVVAACVVATAVVFCEC